MYRLSHRWIGLTITVLVPMLVGVTGISLFIYEILADFGRYDQGGETVGTVLRATAGLFLAISSCMEFAFAARALRGMPSAARLGIWAQLALVLTAIVRIDATLQRQPYDMYLRWGLVLVAVVTLSYILISSWRPDRAAASEPDQTSVVTGGPEPARALMAGVAIALGTLGMLGGLALIFVVLYAASGITLHLLIPAGVIVGSAAVLVAGIAALQSPKGSEQMSKGHGA